MNEPERFDAKALWATVAPDHQAEIGAAALMLMLCVRGAEDFPSGNPYELAEPHAMDELIGKVSNGTDFFNRDTIPLPPIGYGEPVCRVCGCTNDNACVDPATGPCCWIETDLCSACMPRHFAEPLALGSQLVSIEGENDSDEVGNPQHTGPNAVGKIDHIVVDPVVGGFTYGVIFDRPAYPDDPVYVHLYSKEVQDPAKYTVPAPEGAQ